MHRVSAWTPTACYEAAFFECGEKAVILRSSSPEIRHAADQQRDPRSLRGPWAAPSSCRLRWMSRVFFLGVSLIRAWQFSDGSLCQHCVCTCYVKELPRVRKKPSVDAIQSVCDWVCACEKQEQGAAEIHSLSVRKEDMNKQIDE